MNDATEERDESGNDQPEHSGDEGERAPAETGGGGEPEPSPAVGGSDPAAAEAAGSPERETEEAVKTFGEMETVPALRLMARMVDELLAHRLATAFGDRLGSALEEMRQTIRSGLLPLSETQKSVADMKAELVAVCAEVSNLADEVAGLAQEVKQIGVAAPGGELQRELEAIKNADADADAAAGASFLLSRLAAGMPAGVVRDLAQKMGLLGPPGGSEKARPTPEEEKRRRIAREIAQREFEERRHAEMEADAQGLRQKDVPHGQIRTGWGRGPVGVENRFRH